MTNFRRFLRFLKPYKWQMALVLLLMFTVTGLSLTIPRLMGYIWDRMWAFYDRKLDPDVGVRFLVAVCLGLLGIRLAIALVSYVRAITLIRMGQRILFDIRQKLYRHLQRLSMRFYESQRTGWIMARVLWDVDRVSGLMQGQLLDIISQALTLVAVVAYLLYLNWHLALIGIMVLPLYALNFSLFRKRIRQTSREVSDKYADIYGTLHEQISGVKVVKAFSRERHETKKLIRELREYLGLNVRLGRTSSLMHIIAGLLTGGGTILLLWFGGRDILSQRMTPGDLIAFIGYLGMLYSPILMLLRVTDVITQVMAAIDRIFITFDTAPDVVEKKDAISLPPIAGRVEFQDVSFAYQVDEMVLKDISFVAEPGKVVALVGPSGGGKTTLVNLIPRFYDPTSGRVLIDGYDLRDVRLNSLRRQIGMVLQETFLFAGSIKDNIRYGKVDATDDEIVEAAIAANAHEFIMELPDGYETELGERGVRLSGGQRQRIAIARAILPNPRILILDEATSSLDSESEALIQEALDELMKNRTTFVIAHRLSTVMNADEILVIEEGRITERGTHSELESAGGTYARLCEVQFRRAEEERRRRLALEQASM